MSGRSESRWRVLSMGQTSSQARSSEPGIAQTPQTMSTEKSQGESSHKKKSRRKYKAAVEVSDREEESARALLQLKEGVAPSSVGDSAASALLPALQDNGDEIEVPLGSDEPQPDVKRSKQKRKRHEFQEQDENSHIPQDHVGHKRARHSNSTRLSNGQPPNSLSHDDITADQSVSRFPLQYENKVRNSIPPAEASITILVEPPIQQLAATVYDESSDAHQQPSDQVQSRNITPPRGASHKNKQKSRSYLIEEDVKSIGQEQTNDAGQHAFDFGSGAFDEYFMSQPQLDLANHFDNYAGVAVNIDPHLMNGLETVVPAGQGPVEALRENVDTSTPRANHNNKKKKKKKKKKKNRKSQAPPIMETIDSPGDEQTNDTGQHASNFDFETFEEYLDRPQLDSANFIDEFADISISIDPDLINELGTVMSAGKHSADDLQEKLRGQVRPAKRVRASSPKPKPADKDTLFGAFNSLDDQQEGVGDDQQNQVLPEFEDLPQRSSVYAGSSEDRSIEPEGLNHHTSRLRRNNTPPPLAKASQPRGNKTQQGGKRGKNYDPPLEKVARTGGLFTQTEIEKMDAFRDAYCRENQVSMWQFNEYIHSAGRGNEIIRCLWDSVHEVTPYRTRMSTQRFCRRRYHNFAVRGVWTQSEDESLKQAVAEKGKSWKAVGEMIGRMQEDCRDRYRNYHVNAEHRNREQWTEAEILNLCRAVRDCMVAMKEERKRAKLEKFEGREAPESEPESDEEVQDMKLINWQAVSDQMGPLGGGRSRLQCSFKWSKLKTEQRKIYLKQVEDLLKGKQPIQRDKPAKKKNWRLKKAHKTLKNMRAGDRYDFLQAFARCGAIDEGNIPWRLLGDEDFRSRWKLVERKAALEKFKTEVPGGITRDYRDVVNKLLTTLMAVSSHRLGERWDRNNDVDVNLERKRLNRKERKETRERSEKVEKKRNAKSDEFVHSSDEEEEEVAEETTNEEDAVESGVADADSEAEGRSTEEVTAKLSVSATNYEAQEDPPNKETGAYTDGSPAREAKASSRMRAAATADEGQEDVDNTDGSPAREIRDSLRPSASATDEDEAGEDQITEEVGANVDTDSLFDELSVDADNDSLFGESHGSAQPSAAATDDEMQEDQHEEAGADTDNDSVFGKPEGSSRSASPDEDKDQEDAPVEDTSDASPVMGPTQEGSPNKESARIVRVNGSAIWKPMESSRLPARSRDTTTQKESSDEASRADTDASPESSDEDSEDGEGFSLGRR